MKILRLIVAILSFSGAARSDDLTTPDGRTFKNVTITHVDPDGVHVMYDGGCGKIPFEQLPLSLQKKYGYDPNAAASFISTEAKREAQSDALRKQVDAAAARSKSAQSASAGSVQSVSSVAVLQSDPKALSADQVASIQQRIQTLQDDIAFMEEQERKLVSDRHVLSTDHRELSRGGYAERISEDESDIRSLNALLNR